MAKADERRLQRSYHAVVAILLLLGGGAMLGLGIWLTVSDNPGGVFNLDYVGDGGFFDVILRTNIISMIVGAFLLLSGVVALIALAKNAFGKVMRFVHIIMTLIIFLVLAALCVLSALLIARRNDTNIRNFVRDAWIRTAKSETSVLCHIENTFECRGFYDYDCVGCLSGKEDTCANVADLCVPCSNTSYTVSPAEGCYYKITDSLRNLLLPISIISGVLALVVLVDVFFTCCL